MALTEAEELELLELQEQEAQANKRKPALQGPPSGPSGLIPVGGAVGGGAAGVVGQNVLDEAAPWLKDKAADIEFNALGGAKTKEGRSVLANEIGEEGGFTPREIGRASLDQGGIGIQRAKDYRDKLSDLKDEQIKAKNASLADVPGDLSVHKTFDDAEKNLHLERLDPSNPEYGDLTSALKNARDTSTSQMASLQDRGIRTPAEMEQLKTQLQSQAEKSGAYGLTNRAEAATAQVNAARAKAAKDAAEAAVLEKGGQDALDAFRKQKAGIGKNSVAMRILEQKALRDAKATHSILHPMKLADQIAAKLLPGTAAKALNGLGTGAELVGKKIGKHLPIIGAGIGGLLGYNEARAEGESPMNAAVSGVGGAITSLDPTGLADATKAGPPANSPDAMLENGDQAGFLINKAPDRLKGVLAEAAKRGPAAIATTHRMLMQSDPEYRRAILGGESPQQ